MNNLQEVMQKIGKTPELKDQFLDAVQTGRKATAAFLHSQGCDVSVDEMMAALDDVLGDDRELAPDEIEFIAGGSKAGAKKAFRSIGEFSWGFMEGTNT